MKNRHQIVIILFIGLALFVARDDVRTVYNRGLSYVSPKVKDLFIKSTKDNIILQSDKISDLLKSINTPGALKVTTGGLISDTSTAKLTNKDVIDWTNKNRTLNGNLPPLKENSKLNLSAQIKLNDMFKQQYFEHISPDKIGVSDLGNRVGYDYIIIGENLALGDFKDSQALLDAWMASPGHRANILNNNYTEIGIAVGRSMYNGQNTWIAVQHFGLPRSACPAIDEVLHGIITLDQKQIKIMGNDLAARRSNIDSGVVYEGMTTNEQIAKYNELVATYNKLILDVKKKISDYNVTVRAFNSCLQANAE